MKDKKFNFKNIHLGNLIESKVKEDQIKLKYICQFFNCTEKEIQDMYFAETLDTKLLLGWSKFLRYDFFRIYSEHLILYSPPSAVSRNQKKTLVKKHKTQFRKNIYTKEIIDFILEIIETGEKSISQIIDEYGIPSSTLHKWIDKYKV
ncbi:transposase [Chryseobacterium nematophagum]|uniref:Transposase n=1 Tax=Chryseobacterium nematophagum TaxID=2305228 RepID=A0A3M7TJL1_9FLAO|nr:transposase [Chryseobacterium nematophagum]RNA63752.1 transposase [Chryseobacterium nematophagum]